MRICAKCVLPETFPGITFDGNGMCNFCLGFKGGNRVDSEREKMRQRFEELVEQVRGKATYDFLMCYSGGKDSTYTLRLLKKKFDVNVLAVTFDNGFIPDQTFINVRNVCEALCVDHITVKPRFDVLRKIFCAASEKVLFSRKGLERGSTICTACIAIVKFGSLRLAIEKEIPVVCYGWSPGQAPTISSVFKNNPDMLFKMQKAVFDPLYDIVRDDLRPYFLEEKHFPDSSKFPYNVSPLAFYEYDEGKILREISLLGWKRPTGLDANSSNCMLNSYANLLHKRQFGFHPYVWELANMVRTGRLDREAALEAVTSEEDAETLAAVESRLGIPGSCARKSRLGPELKR